jgi:hypothetical protein
LSWIPPEDTSQVTHYMIYLAVEYDLEYMAEATWNTSVRTTRIDHNRSLIGNQSVDLNNFTVPVDTFRGTHTHFWIYTLSSFVEQTTPEAQFILDEDSSASQVRFSGADLDLVDLGGNITWTEPVSSHRLLDYHVFLAMNSSGRIRSRIGEPVALGTLDAFFWPPSLEYFAAFRNEYIAIDLRGSQIRAFSKHVLTYRLWVPNASISETTVAYRLWVSNPGIFENCWDVYSCLMT